MKKFCLALIVNAVILGPVLIAQEGVTFRQITSDSAREGFPSWSPDGKTIVYSFFNMVQGRWLLGSRKISVDGGGSPIQFTDFPTEHPQWSPDGGFIVFDADTGASIKIIDANGGSPRTFIPDSIVIRKGGLPIWSPSGSHIAFKDSAGSLWVYSLKAGIFARVFHQSGTVVLPGCWSPDGKSILVAIMDVKTRLSTVWKISADASERRQITGHRDSLYRYLALSPDGSLLVYGAMQGRRLGLWIMPAEGGKSIPLAVSDQHHNESPSWSPDGKRIAFASGRTGRGDIYLMDVDLEKIKSQVHALDQ